MQTLVLELLIPILGLATHPDRVEPPSDYATLAASVSTPLFASEADARAGYKEGQVLLRMEQARQRLLVLRPVDSELDALRRKLLTSLDACHWTMEEIRALDRSVPDIEGLAKATLPALSGIDAMVSKDQKFNDLQKDDKQAVAALALKAGWEIGKAVFNSFKTSEQWDTYRSQYTEARKASKQLSGLAAKRCQAPRPGCYGVGLDYTWKDDGPNSAITVTQVLPGGVAERAGLRVGDEIVEVDGERVALELTSGGRTVSKTLKLDVLTDHLRLGAKDSPVSIGALRGNKAIALEMRRTMKLQDEPELIALDVDGSFEGAFQTDEITFTNVAHRDLTNCTLEVTLRMHSGRVGIDYVEKHVHFVDHWRDGESLVALYHGRDAAGIARDESLSQVQRVSVELYSDQARNTIQHEYYDTPEYSQDVQRYCEGFLNFKGRFMPETDGFFTKGDGLYQDDAFVRIWLEDGQKKVLVSKITPSKITVTVRKGQKSESRRWNGSTWESGELFPFKTFQSSAFNAFRNPDSYEVRLAFPGTDYEHVLLFR